MKVLVGDKIRSYDFKPMDGRADCYVEGIVTEFNALATCGYNAYKILVTKDYFGGDSLPKNVPGSRVDKVVFVPWRVDFSEFQGRVINLSRM